MNKLLLTICFILISISLIGQSGLVIKKIGISVGSDEDLIRDLDYSYMLSTAKGIEQSQYAGLNFAPQDLYGGVCENPNISVELTLGVPGLSFADLNVAATGMFNRYDGVYYDSRKSFDSFDSHEYLSINSYNSEFNLEVSLIKGIPILNFLNVYVGAGTNMGYSFGHNVQLDGIALQNIALDRSRSFGDMLTGDNYTDFNYSSFEMRDGISNRVFAQLGAGITFFKRVELGATYRKGIGTRAIFGAPFVTTQLNGFYLNLRYVLNK